jgi:peptidoglycan L-alanyl-D-glutamate endopeptidase CwlK
MKYFFGKTSVLRVKDVNEYLVMTSTYALTHSPVDMSIPWRGGKRTAEQQKELFEDKATRCDGYIKKSFHQTGDAIDIVPYIKGKINYKATKEFQKFAKIMLASFKFLQAIGYIPSNLYLHWGGFWSAKDENNDGILHYIDDEFGWDQPHWEIRTIPQSKTFILF